MTRPSLADITQRAEARAAYEGRSDAEYDPDVATDLACASAADVPALSTAIHDVLAVADQFDRLAARHPDSETGQVETAAAHEIRRAVTAHIDTTPKEKP